MTRRATAILLGVLLMLMLVVAAIRSPVPFVTVEPGLTVDVLAKQGSKPIVRVDGGESFPTTGALRMVTVSETTPEHEVLLLEALNAWWRPGMALIPREIAFPEPTTNQDERAASAAQMVGSQDSAVAAALQELGYELESFPVIAGVSPGGPAEGNLKVHDRIVSIGGVSTPDVDRVFEAVREIEPGDEVAVEVRRGGAPRRITLETVPSPEDPKRAMIGVFPATGYDFPVDVSVGISDTIGGPSAGLVFALAIYDTLTPGSLTGGASVAATGTMDADGRVGGIGGIAQKIVGAERDGASLFLLPPDNCDSATAAAVDEDEIALVPTGTLDEAIEAVRTHGDDPDAELPRCPDES